MSRTNYFETLPKVRLFYGSENKIKGSPLSVRQMAHSRAMDDKEFRRKLSEVADWIVPKTQQETSNNAKKKRGRKSNEELYMELREEIFHQEFDGNNPTIPPLLIKLKHKPITCDDCGTTCTNGRQKEKKLYEANKKAHWRERCITCGMTQNPYTGAFDLNSQRASVVWNTFMRETKGVYASKGNLSKEQGIITIYPEKNKPT